MKMRIKSAVKKAAATVFAAVFALLASGCETFITDTEKLITPPELTGEMQPINEALKKSVKGEYSLVYPTSGEYRSAIALKDTDGDGVKEAFAFYTVPDGETVVMHLNFIKSVKGSWKSFADTTLEAGGIEKVEFCDLNGDGNEEIAVGFEVFGGSEKKLGVYSVSDKKLSERLMEKYSVFTCFDFDEDGKSELFLQNLITAEKSNVASVYNFSKKGFNKAAACLMDGKANSVYEPIKTTLTGGKPALYIDEDKGSGGITEVLYMENGELINPLFDGNKGENTVTQRSFSIFCTDIDLDGTIDIPTSSELPMADGSAEKSNYTNWCGFDGKTLTVKTTTVYNQADGYYLLIPSKLFDNIALLRNTEKRSRTFYSYDSATGSVGKKLFKITAVPLSESEQFKAKNKNSVKLDTSAQTVYFGEVYESSTDILTKEELKQIFRCTEG